MYLWFHLAQNKLFYVNKQTISRSCLKEHSKYVIALLRITSFPADITFQIDLQMICQLYLQFQHSVEYISIVIGMWYIYINYFQLNRTCLQPVLCSPVADKLLFNYSIHFYFVGTLMRRKSWYDWSSQDEAVGCWWTLLFARPCFRTCYRGNQINHIILVINNNKRVT